MVLDGVELAGNLLISTKTPDKPERTAAGGVFPTARPRKDRQAVSAERCGGSAANEGSCKYATGPAPLAADGGDRAGGAGIAESAGCGIGGRLPLH